MGYITLDRSLTAIQSLSAAGFGAFLLLHVPASAASVLGEPNATQLMLIGRELYQSDFLEPIFLGSAALHVGSGLARRLHRHGWKSFRSLSLHALSGYLLVPLVSFHVYMHRWLPLKMDISNDISYSFTSLFLQQYPALAWTHYTLISSLASLHVIGGLRALLSGRRSRRPLVLSKNTPLLAGSWAALMGTLGIGLVRLSRTGLEGFVKGKYEKVLRVGLGH